MSETASTVEINEKFMFHQATCKVCSTSAGLCPVGLRLIEWFHDVIVESTRRRPI